MPSNPNPPKRLPRGAIPSPRSVLAAATPHAPDPNISVPPSFLAWPIQMAYWNNYIYGDCVSAEEAFAKATAAPQTFIPEATVVAWATSNGYLNGATLTGVMTTMQTNGFPVGGEKYNDGPYLAVDWTNPAILQSAIFSHGPVKIGVGADDFQGNANGCVTPGTSGWAMYNYPKNAPEDHCVSLCGFGTLGELVGLFKQQNVTVNVPNGMPTGLCYALFTWNSIGIVDEQSMLNMTYEAWIRNPVTIIEDGNWARTITPAAAAMVSDLTCFGVGGSATRVYYLDTGNNIQELAWEGSWVVNATGAVASSDSPLTCFGVGGTATRVYYLDTSGNVKELAWENGWVVNSTGAVAAANSPLTCFGVGGTATRVYYLDRGGNINELSWEGKWVINSTGAVAAPNSPLACFGVGGAATRVYYLDAAGNIKELAWQGNWVINSTGAVAAPHSPLTCFGVGGTATRVYYLDTSGNINELAWEGKWVINSTGAVAAISSSLTCFGVGGAATRVYYLDASGNINELAWEGGWVVNTTGAVASMSSPLTCFAVGGSATRVYYFDRAGRLSELAWEG
jgi:hypothetical protein